MDMYLYMYLYYFVHRGGYVSYNIHTYLKI